MTKDDKSRAESLLHAFDISLSCKEGTKEIQASQTLRWEGSEDQVKSIILLGKT